MAPGSPSSIEAQIRSVPRWYHTLELAPGVVTPGEFDLRPIVDEIPWPDVRGKRCLDIGTYDGFLAFELERRGAAEVVCTDLREHSDWDLPDYAKSDELASMQKQWGEKGRGFLVAKEALGSKVTREWINVYDLSPDSVGTFDVVVMGSLLLHLSDPVGALRAIRSICTGQFLSIEAIDLVNTMLHPKRPTFHFMGTARLRQWFVANAAGHASILHATRFEVERRSKRYSIPFGVTHGTLPKGPKTIARRAIERAMTRGNGVPHQALLTRPF